MNSDLGLLLVSVGAALLAGLVLGTLLGALLRRGVARPAPLPPPSGNAILSIEGDPVLRRLTLRVGGQPVAGADSIADVAVREHVRALLRLLDQDPAAPPAPAAFSAAAPAPAPVALSAEPSAPAAVAAPPAPAALSAEPSAPAPLPAAEPLAAPLPEVEDDLSAPFLSRLRSSLQPQPVPAPKPAAVPLVRMPKLAAAAQPPADMFEQINAILHRKLAAMPLAPDIQLYGEDGELRILVGGAVYRKVEEVSDDRARGWIREAVSEWEAS